MSLRPRYGPVTVRGLRGLRIAIAKQSAGPAIHVLDGDAVTTIVIGPRGQLRQVLDVPPEIVVEIRARYFADAEPIAPPRSPLAL